MAHPELRAQPQSCSHPVNPEQGKLTPCCRAKFPFKDPSSARLTAEAPQAPQKTQCRVPVLQQLGCAMGSGTHGTHPGCSSPRAAPWAGHRERGRNPLNPKKALLHRGQSQKVQGKGTAGSRVGGQHRDPVGPPGTPQGTRALCKALPGSASARCSGRGLEEEGKGAARWETEVPVTSFPRCCSADSSRGGGR